MILYLYIYYFIMEPNEIYEKEVISDKNHSVKIELKSIENKLDF